MESDPNNQCHHDAAVIMAWDFFILLSRMMPRRQGFGQSCQIGHGKAPEDRMGWRSRRVSESTGARNSKT